MRCAIGYNRAVRDPDRTRELEGTELSALPVVSEAQEVTLEVLDPAGLEVAPFAAGSERTSIGSHPSNDLVLGNDTVSRLHCEIVSDERGARVRDLGSRNGTFVDSVRVEAAWLRHGSELRAGGVTLRVGLGDKPLALPLSSAERVGGLVGRSVAMRRAFALLERCAPSDVTVLLHGETGTGKEGAAEAIHAKSRRAEGPFVVVDCASIPPNLLESELFGHEKGSFTGAVATRIGAFEEADGGTIFLDEIGEVPPDLQPKLLRAFERRTVRRVGSNKQIPVDIRIIAATHRALHREVNDGRFRADLYYRLAVVKIELPALRERLDDLPLITAALLREIGAPEDATERLLAPDFQRRLRGHAFPGNVRELRNVLERAMVLDEAFLSEPSASRAKPSGGALPPVSLSYGDARTMALSAFEEAWLAALLDAHGGNVAQAARAAGMARPYLHRLLRRHGIRGE